MLLDEAGIEPEASFLAHTVHIKIASPQAAQLGFHFKGKTVMLPLLRTHYRGS